MRCNTGALEGNAFFDWLEERYKEATRSAVDPKLTPQQREDFEAVLGSLTLVLNRVGDDPAALEAAREAYRLCQLMERPRLRRFDPLVSEARTAAKGRRDGTKKLKVDTHEGDVAVAKRVISVKAEHAHITTDLAACVAMHKNAGDAALPKHPELYRSKSKHPLSVVALVKKARRGRKWLENNPSSKPQQHQLSKLN